MTTHPGRFDLKGRTLRVHAARGTLINGVFTVGLAGLGLLRGFALAALLMPEDFGVWGILIVSLGNLTWLKQVGIGDKFVQQDEPDQEQAFQKAFTLEALLNAGLMVLMAAAVPIVAVVYEEPALVAPGFALLALLPAQTLQAPLWILYRQMRFAHQRALQAIDPVVGLVATVALALAGAGYWALVAGTLVGAFAGALAAVTTCPYPLRWRYDRGTARSYVSFSTPLLVAGVASIAVVQGYLLLGDAAAGLAGAGAITLAASISVLTDRVDAIITQTIYPAICAVAERTELLFESFVKSNRLALMWALPFGFGLALFAPDLVTFVLGERWEVAVSLLQAFGAVAALNHLGFNWTAFLRARGQTRPIAVYALVVLGVFASVTAPLLLTVGLDGLALGMVVSTIVGLGVRALYLTRLFPGFHLLSHAARALAPSVAPITAVLAVRLVDGGGPRIWGGAIAELALYLGLTVLGTLVFERALLREAIGYLRGRAPAPLPTAV